MKYRIERVCKTLRRELGILILKELQFRAPLVSVSSVDATPDLRHAYVYISALGNNQQREDALRVLASHRVYLQHAVSKRITLRYTPHLHFRSDKSIERGIRIIKLMDELGFPDLRSD
ncbi:Ribosome-binding factor A [Candidatus Xiphinematobacter sp. Idaho Grape]|uniref:30S ribosome-binding factor RbfA n=1 Tax=Candidatus Xiphinematobacter sp. Idaho Grape TaxID=1704307 RepID=UPI000706432F|nr:30S ribosome-binding factor RbfA [Candidatus Xiphinematobacter sp. Idaho Grape]ALJ56337.1 Ribosome-binding factor A [Candidatus Xiphinematobacter sp. Idaho Grape]